MVGRQGFEPRFHGSEPCVLPLNDLPTAGEANKRSVRGQSRFARSGSEGRLVVLAEGELDEGALFELVCFRRSGGWAGRG